MTKINKNNKNDKNIFLIFAHFRRFCHYDGGFTPHLLWNSPRPTGPGQKSNRSRRSTKGAGFTLFEVLVATSAFGILIVMVTAGFAQALKLQRRAFNIQQVQENINFVIEFIAREARVSEVQNSIFNPDCPDISPAPILCLDHPVNGIITYSLSGNEVHRNVNGVDSILTSNKVEFTRFDLYITGATTGDNLQPKTTVVVSARSKGTSEQVTIDTQITVSQRLLGN